MNKLISNFIIGAAFTAVASGLAPTAAADSSGGVITRTLLFSPDSVAAKAATASDGNEYLMMSAPDCSEFGEPGDISLPYKFVSFIVPASTNKFSVSITSSETSQKSIDASKDPYPIQEPQKTDGSPAPEFTPLKSTSGIASAYLPKVADECLVNGNAHIVTMAIPLGEYSAATKRISLYNSADISLSYNVCESSELPFTVMTAPSTELDIDVTEIVLNKDNVTAYVPASRKQLKARYYILTPEYLEPYVHDIAGWKRQKGFDVTVKTYEEFPEEYLNIATSFITGRNYGGVAFIGNSRSTFIAQSDNLEQRFGREINKGYDIGTSIVRSAIDDHNLHIDYTRNLIGSPDLKIWKE